MHLPLLLAAGLTAHAAEVTDLPTPMRGVAGLDYTAAGDIARLMEDDVQVGARQERQHTLTFHGAFSPYQGVALAVALPVVADQRLVFSQAHQMAFDPNQGSGSMVGAAAIDPLPTVKGGGLGGTLLALQLSPFNTDLFGPRGDRTTWVLEAGYRFQDKSSWWQQKDDGKRGAGPGGDAVHMRTAFSSTHPTSRPYIEAIFDKAFAVPTDLWDEEGVVVVQDAPVKPASRLSFRVGAEIPVTTSDTVAVSVDVRSRFGYRTWQDIPSGLYLPDVLSASREILVTQGEALHASGGVGLQLRFPQTIDVLLGGDFGVESPYRIEHPYQVGTDLGTMTWDAQLAVRVWIDDQLLGLD